MKHTSHTRAVRILSDLFYFFSIFIFINAFNFQHNPPGVWRPQFIENMSGRYLPDMMFVDSLVGYSVSNNQGPGINYVSKPLTEATTGCRSLKLRGIRLESFF
ncbi:MAG: hypothetical protein IPG99_16580 [Ignavibacteria bacterium]|nr:hypothetical protein [Ignavibacteria bacterium]